MNDWNHNGWGEDKYIKLIDDMIYLMKHCKNHSCVFNEDNKCERHLIEMDYGIGADVLYIIEKNGCTFNSPEYRKIVDELMQPICCSYIEDVYGDEDDK